MARKRVSGVSRNSPFLPSKQAHALSPLGADFHPPFFCKQRVASNGYGSTPYHLFGRETAHIQPKLINFYAEVLIYV
jgi:hypothetical protein